MSRSEDSIWARLDTCVHALHEPFTAAQIMAWFRRHYPDVNEASLRAHIQSANSTSPDRGTLGYRAPLITRVDHGLYVRAAPATMTARPSQAAPLMPVGQLEPAAAADEGEWHAESRVQASVVSHLATEGWLIESVADTATKAHGVDIVATRDARRIGVEVKGFPSKKYADPARADEIKRTRPATQARHWFAMAILAALRLRSNEPETVSVIALPDFPTYRSLYADTTWALDQVEVQVWWVTADGTVTTPHRA